MCMLPSALILVMLTTNSAFTDSYVGGCAYVLDFVVMAPALAFCLAPIKGINAFNQV